jgi:predicted nucleic-acid-binding protein
MIGLDTNVLVRYLTQDDPAQFAAVDRLIRKARHTGEAFFLNQIVLCEAVWVLESVYRYSREVIAQSVEKLLMTVDFEIDQRDDVWVALAEYKRYGADFADYLIGRCNVTHGCGHTVTFDRLLKGASGFQLL